MCKVAVDGGRAATFWSCMNSDTVVLAVLQPPLMGSQEQELLLRREEVVPRSLPLLGAAVVEMVPCQADQLCSRGFCFAAVLPFLGLFSSTRPGLIFRISSALSLNLDVVSLSLVLSFSFLLSLSPVLPLCLPSLLPAPRLLNLDSVRKGRWEERYLVGWRLEDTGREDLGREGRGREGRGREDTLPRLPREAGR